MSEDADRRPTTEECEVFASHLRGVEVKDMAEVYEDLSSFGLPEDHVDESLMDMEERGVLVRSQGGEAVLWNHYAVREDMVAMLQAMAEEHAESDPDPGVGFQ